MIINSNRYVTSLENRVQQLEALVARLLPDGDVESALFPIPPLSSPDFNTVEPTGGTMEITASLAEEKEMPSEGSPDDLPILSNGFEWSEQDDDPTNYIADGMAALSVDPQGVGYLGSAANVSLLRSLQRSGWSLLNTWGVLLQPSNHRQLRATLIDAYFYHYHPAYPIVHEATFRAQYNEILPKPNCSDWELLRNTILCIGAWCLGHDVSGLKDLFGPGSQGFKKFTATFSSGNLIMVQALTLWSNYTQRQNKPNTSWNYQGLAVRMALSLGLHKEFPAWNISLLDREIRRRVWWFLYIADSGASMTFGRPVLLPEAGGSMDIELFLNVHDDCLTAATTEAPEDANEPTLYSSLLIQTKFHLMASPLYARRIGNPDLGVNEVMSMNSKISSWMLSIPHYFQESANLPNSTESLTLSRYRFFWRVRNFRMLLLWPILIHYTEKTHNIPNARDNEMDETARQLCLRYAHDTITSIDEYLLSRISGAFGDWYALYYLIQASLIPIIAMLTVPESPDAVVWTADIETTKRILGSVVTHQELAGPVTVMDQFANSFGHFSETAHGAIVSAILIPAAITALFGGHLADSVGRVKAMALGAAIFGVGAAFEAGATHIAMFVVGRGLAGVGEGFFLSTISVYVTEISPPRIRGLMGGIPQFFISFGLCAGYFVCYGSANIVSSVSWRLPFAIQSLVAFVFLVVVTIGLPESPRWLTSMGRKAEAAANWEKLKVLPEDREAIIEDTELIIHRTVSRPTSVVVKSKINTLFAVFSPTAWRRTTLGIFLNAAQQLSGIDGVLYYAPTLFLNAGLSSSKASFLASGVSALLIFATTIPAFLLADHWNRRTNILTGGSIQAMCMIIIGALYASGQVSPGSAGAWTVIVLIYLFTIGFSGTWAVVIRIVTSEVQPAATRAAATSLAQATNWVVNFVVALTTPLFLARSAGGVYFMFGFSSVIAVIVCVLWMPETRGRSLEDIEGSFDGKRRGPED
ncbi:hypothetical protein V502_08758 [Pseudogymnoascus sp. VKM F-4520 (FW-2644)]|nr:hypothetical protein V502_08758 [Pseudogymnoascus sp. VKM F-4520 (FW-2644)]